jgi:UDP:flavonoid glycosyltransferase YjiC (YdhE family)
MRSGHFLLTTFGSFGDLHPYIAVGLGLRARGHTVTIGTSEAYRAKVEAEGLLFHPIRPNLGEVFTPEVIRQAMHPRKGTEFVFRKLMLPWFEQSFEDTAAAAREADVIVGHPIAFATPVVAEYLKKTWISVALQPSVFLSEHDPFTVSGAPVINWLVSLGPGFTRAFLRFARRVMHGWGAPVNAYRKKLGLREVPNPLLDGMFSPHGTQAWFSRVMARPQVDWPARVDITGFPFYDKLEAGHGLNSELARFLDAGPAPVAFTLGSSVVYDAGAFYEQSLEAVQRIGCRAVLLVGRDTGNAPAGPVPDNVFVAEYAPYSELLPRAAATVHQGGVGTTAQALRAGKPMIVVPRSHDQPDNGRRIAQRGVGRVIPRGRYRADRVVRELETILKTPSYADAARGTAAEMEREDGVAAACEGLIGAAGLNR